MRLVSRRRRRGDFIAERPLRRPRKTIGRYENDKDKAVTRRTGGGATASERVNFLFNERNKVEGLTDLHNDLALKSRSSWRGDSYKYLEKVKRARGPRTRTGRLGRACRQ